MQAQHRSGTGPGCPHCMEMSKSVSLIVWSGEQWPPRLSQQKSCRVRIADLLTLAFLFACLTTPESQVLGDFLFIRWSEYKFASDP